MNQKQRKAKLKRAQQHQRQCAEERKGITQHYAHGNMDTWQKYIDKANEKRIKAPKPSECLHITVPRRYASLSYWFQCLVVKLAMGGKAAKRLFSTH